jgi:hypothetical protein
MKDARVLISGVRVILPAVYQPGTKQIRRDVSERPSSFAICNKKAAVVVSEKGMIETAGLLQIGCKAEEDGLTLWSSLSRSVLNGWRAEA